MIYPSIRIEGAILSPDVLDRLDDLAGQRPADFGLEGTAKVKDEIARAWADAQDYWRIFQRKLESVRADSPATTETRQQWVLPLLGLLGYQLDFQPKSAEANGKLYPLSHRVANRGGTVVHVTGHRDPAGLDRKAEQRSSGLRMSAHAMVQEYLNLADELYGLVTNGRVLRLLRDSSRLIKLTYLEFDLDRIFSDGLFADFAVLYRLLHATRLPANRDDAAQSWIERYHQDSLDAGSRIREGLSKAVEHAIKSLANGFLQHKANDDLRQQVESGRLSAEEFYKHLLRLIYRLLFLMVIEERGLVFPPSVQSKHREVYEQFYSLMRLRRMSEKRHLADRRYADLWPALLATFRLFEAGGPGAKMGVPPLAGDLFSPPAIGILARCTLGNDVLLGALRALNLYAHPDNGQLIRVNYGALNVEEFGSVYEGLLEYEPVILPDGAQTTFAFKQGDERANTGSHYTPDELVQPLIKHSLDHLIAERLKAKDPEAALLSLRVADVACGSGHILLAAARRIGQELAVVRTGEDQPSPLAMRTAVRDVIRCCIYGVDLNPLAVELCKVALWLEAHVPGEPLSFMDHHIKCGNAIVGYVRREDIESRGIPDEAFETMPGDDKEVAALLRQRNKAERAGQKSLEFDPKIERKLDEALKGWRGLDTLPEHTPEQVEAKRQRFESLSRSAEVLWMEQLASIPIAQFYIPKVRDQPEMHVTEEEFGRYCQGELKTHSKATAEAWAVAERKRFFHWFLAFPEAIAAGGFDCILGNPPYLGGKKISGTFGDAVLSYLTWVNVRTGGLCDLVTYFIRRQYGLLRDGGFLSLITTNSVAEGDTRAGGLAHIQGTGGFIAFAVRSMRWPGRAVLEVALLSIRKGGATVDRYLNGRPVAYISSRLDEEPDTDDPLRLKELSGRIYVGSIISGKGFLLDREARDGICERDPRSAEVIKTYIGGDDVVRRPDQSASRFVIDFGDFTEEQAATYPECFAIAKERVWPDRKDVKKDVYRNRWWQFAERQARLYESIRQLEHVLVIPQTARWLTVSCVPNQGVFAFGLAVVTTDRLDILAVLQSCWHYEWVKRYSSSLKTDLRYTPSDCFETFPFPRDLWQGPNSALAQIGKRYHEHRRRVMRELWLGLTDVYNMFHARDLSPELVAKASKKPADVASAGFEDLLELRRLQVALDNAVRDAYGWTDLNLGHDFVAFETLPENDRVRYTISAVARREVLKRLLALNHQQAKEEAASAPAVKPKGTGRKKAAAPAPGPGLFNDL
jgi:SAM-dependent methyltransferase